MAVLFYFWQKCNENSKKMLIWIFIVLNELYASILFEKKVTNSNNYKPKKENRKTANPRKFPISPLKQ